MSDTDVSDSLEPALQQVADSIGDVLDDLLPDPEGPEEQLYEAMRYATLGGGKRLRPFLALTSARLFNVAEHCAMRVAAAVEMVHAYSLVHDDLPAMDDDDLRRGRPSCHVAFGEATAILAGDALLALAFEVLAETETHADPQVRCELVRTLAEAAGGSGMVGGQMIDLAAEHTEPELVTVTRMQRMKTGAIIAFSCESGAILGKAADAPRKALHAYAHDLGLAFQIADDLLDAVGDAGVTGKRVQKDVAAGKATFVALLGVERAREQAAMLADQAIQHLDLFKEKADLLRAVARFVIDRKA